MITFSTIVSYSAMEICLYLFYRKNVIAQLKKDKMIDHHTLLRENDNLPLWRAPMKKQPCFNRVRANHV